MFAIHENKCAHKSNNVPLFSSENQSQFTILQWISHIHILDTFIFLKEVLTIPIQFSNLQDKELKRSFDKKKDQEGHVNNEQWTMNRFTRTIKTFSLIHFHGDLYKRTNWLLADVMNSCKKSYANSELWKSNNKSDFFCNSLSSDVFFPFKTHVVLINDQWDLWTQKKQTNNCWKTEFVSQIYCAHFPRCQQRVNVE